ncbi:MAG: FGGY family carbohydrate kinase [Kiloniellales bacterium]
MGSGVFVGIDHGGSTTTALVFDAERGKLAAHSVRMPKHTPSVGWVEHDPEDFLLTGNRAARAALDAAKLTWYDVEAIGIANQGETSMAWSRETGAAIGPAISWQDRRTSAMCEALAAEGLDALVRARTGILLDPYFSASKFKWLIENLPEAGAAFGRGALALGGTDSYVIHRLTGGAVHATDAATASRTALFNLSGLHWDGDLLRAFGLEESALPEIRPTCGDFGTVRHEDFAGAQPPITADAVDAHAALFAQVCWDETAVKATYGTGAFIETNTGARPATPDGRLLVFVAWEVEGRVDYTIEGGVFSVGSAVDWAVSAGLLPSAEGSAALAGSVPDRGGVLVVPCFAGLSAPHWASDARAVILGLGLDSEPGHIARALLDGIAFRCAEVIEALDARMGGSLREVKADGGPTANPYLMQRQADLLNLPVVVSKEPDMTALGAALLAGIGAGQLTRDDVRAMARESSVYEPAMSEDERQAHWAEWRGGVETVLRRRGS